MTALLQSIRSRFRHLGAAQGGATSLEYGLLGAVLALALSGVLREIAAEAVPFEVSATQAQPAPVQ